MTPISMALSVGETLGVDERKFIVSSSSRAGRLHAPAASSRRDAGKRNGAPSEAARSSPPPRSDNSPATGTRATAPEKPWGFQSDVLFAAYKGIGP